MSADIDELSLVVIVFRAAAMSQTTDDTLYAAVGDAGGRNDEDAKENIAAIKKNNRYRRDVY